MKSQLSKLSWSKWIFHLGAMLVGVLFIGFGSGAVAQQAGEGITPPEDAMRVPLKNITRVEGVRDNQLRGYSIVTGLSGSGDGSIGFVNRSIANALKELGISLDQPNEAQLENLAAVMITATLKPFKSSGDKIDVTVSSLGNAGDLSGGVLMQAPLKGANGKTYAVAQGPVMKGGDAEDRHLTTVRMPNGAIVEREVPFDFLSDNNQFYLSLRRSNFTTASRIADQINQTFDRELAIPTNGGRVQVQVPEQFQDVPVDFISIVKGLEVAPATESRVIVNERTGTVLMGEDVQVRAVSISHGDIQLSVSGEGQQANAEEAAGETVMLPQSTSIRQVVDSLNAVGASTESVVAIIEVLDKGNALSAPLVVM